MGLTNCFALSIKTGQFEANNVGCHSVYDPESPFPQFPNVEDGSIALYQFKSIWTLDLNDYDCNTEWNNSFSLYQKPWPKMCCMSLRQDKLRKFIDNRRAKWGRNSIYFHFATAKEGASANNAASDVYQNFYVEDGDKSWQVESPVKKQKFDKDEV
jgi:hypothetical protein